MQINPLGLASHPDPYPIYAALRQQDPVYWSPAAKLWVLTRYADVEAMLKDPRVGHWAAKPPIFSRWTQMMDPSHHTYLHAAVSRFLSQDAIEARRSRIQGIVDEVFHRAKQAGSLDVMSDLSRPLTLALIGDILGIPPDDGPRFQRLIGDLRGGILQLIQQSVRPAEAVAFQAFLQYLHTLIEHKRREPADDFISALIQMQAEGEELTAKDFVSFTLIFLFGGHDNIMSFIGNGALALLRHPEQWQRLREEPSCIDTAFEELLRFDTSLQFVHLAALSDLTLGEKTIEAGDVMLVLIGAANRDPEQFHAPDELDITRQPNRHLSFSTGPLYCIGTALARMQGQVALQAIVQHCDPAGALDAPLQWRPYPPMVRSLVSLPLRLLPPASKA